MTTREERDKAIKNLSMNIYDDKTIKVATEAIQMINNIYESVFYSNLSRDCELSSFEEEVLDILKIY